MNIIQCKICNKLFQPISGNICPSCVNKIDRDFITVRDYIYDNPNSRIDEVSEETGVDKATILQLLKEGRLTLDSPDTDGMLLCDICKKPISTGRMCKECKEKIASTMTKSIGGAKPPEPQKKELKASKYNAKMHTDTLRRK